LPFQAHETVASTGPVSVTAPAPSPKNHKIQLVVRGVEQIPSWLVSLESCAKLAPESLGLLVRQPDGLDGFGQTVEQDASVGLGQPHQPGVEIETRQVGKQAGRAIEGAFVQGDHCALLLTTLPIPARQLMQAAYPFPQDSLPRSYFSSQGE